MSGWRGGAERDAGEIFLALFLERLGQFGGLSDADKQHTCRERVQGAGVADLEVLLVEMPACRPFDLADHIG